MTLLGTCITGNALIGLYKCLVNICLGKGLTW
jgi:hypothetical protein